MALLLRDVEMGDLEIYYALRCDPVMMSELGGPLPREGIPEKVARDVAAVSKDESWMSMIIPDDQHPETVAGFVCLWTSQDDGDPYSEIGWMVLPEFQGKGIAKASVRELLKRARADGRWGKIHAHPGVTNAPSNGICRSLGFTLLGTVDVDFADRIVHSNHWVIDLDSAPII